MKGPGSSGKKLKSNFSRGLWYPIIFPPHAMVRGGGVRDDFNEKKYP